MTDVVPAFHPWTSQPLQVRRACKRAVISQRVVQDIHRIYETLAQLPLFESESQGPALYPLYDEAKLSERLDAVKRLTGDNQQALQKVYLGLQQSDALRPVAQAPNPEVLDELLDSFPNFADVTRWVQEQLVLCSLSPEAALQLPPVLLDGPPGVGKTAYSQALAERIGVAFERIDLSAARSSHHLVGLDAGYSSSHPGRIWESLQRGSLSVTWLLDEIDKIPTEATDSGAQDLLGLLEPVTATQFTDNWTGLPIDASWIFYVATSNDRERIDVPLLSRFTVFDIAAPTTNEARQIVSSIYRGFQQKEQWGSTFQPTLDELVIDALQGCVPRDIRRLLRSALARAAGAGRRHLEVSDIPTQSWRRKTRIGFV
jgi:ATP-dependent Lon protease